MLVPRLRGYNLGQNKVAKQTPIPPPPYTAPQIKNEAAQKPKRANFPSLIWRGGEYKLSIYFVQNRIK